MTANLSIVADTESFEALMDFVCWRYDLVRIKRLGHRIHSMVKET